MHSILAFDPGKTTGWALFENRKVSLVGEVPFEDIWDFLLESRWDDIDCYVVEDYKIRPGNLTGGWSHEWNDGIALQIIGAIKYKAFSLEKAIKLQQPSIKPTAAKFSRINYVPGKKGTHILDAILHGEYFLFKEFGPSAKDELETSNRHSDGTRNDRATRIVEIRSYKGLRKAGSKKRF